MLKLNIKKAHYNLCKDIECFEIDVLYSPLHKDIITHLAGNNYFFIISKIGRRSVMNNIINYGLHQKLIGSMYDSIFTELSTRRKLVHFPDWISSNRKKVD